MLIVLSPSKKLDFDTPPRAVPHTQPLLLDHSLALIEALRKYSPAKLARLMDISDKLARLNAGRYQSFHMPFTAQNARQAVLAFKGDVYEGLKAETFSGEDFAFAQAHVRMLSGLYGLLRPLDLIQPYRLEMGTMLKTPRGKDLYRFWGDIITNTLNEALEQEGSGIVVNLASDEYWQAVNPAKLRGQMITPVFKDFNRGSYRVIGLLAKQARGLMTRFVVQERLTRPEDLQGFTLRGYRFDRKLSDGKRYIFLRKASQKAA